MPVETPKSSFTAGIAGMNRWSESGPMKVMETSAMKKYQRGRKGIVMGKSLGRARDYPANSVPACSVIRALIEPPRSR